MAEEKKKNEPFEVSILSGKNYLKGNPIKVKVVTQKDGKIDRKRTEEINANNRLLKTALD